MLNLIQIKEIKNKLEFQGEVFDIVANSSNFYLQFELDDEWEECEIVTAIFEMKDRTVYVELDENRMCRIPRAEAPLVAVCLTASPSETEKLSSTRLWIKVAPSGDTDLEKVDEYQDAHKELLGLIQKFSNGEIVVKNAESAERASIATIAESTESAVTAQNATHAETAVSATNAEHSETASRATNASYATNAGNAITAETATYATTAGNSTTAENATYATTAGSSETEVSLTGDQTINGTKNFVGTLKTNGEIVASRTQLSNINILINGDFSINQRGSTTYTRNGTDIYTVDRWELYNKNGTFNSSTKTLTGTDSTGDTILCQWVELEQTNRILGREVTLSAIVNGTRVSGSVTLPSQITSNQDMVVASSGAGTLRLHLNNVSKLIRVDLVVKNGSSITVDEVKLEVGEVCTSFVTRTYQEELELCKRYYIKIGNLSGYQNSIFAFGSMFTAKIGFFSIPVRMRTLPTMQKSGNFMALVGSIVEGMNFDVDSMTVNENIVLRGTISSNSVPGYAGFVYIENGASATLKLDAEIY